MVYIRSASSISVQPIMAGVENAAPVTKARFPAIVSEPDYKQYISPALIRRMSPIIKYGVAAGMQCLQQAGVTQPEAVITGTGLGCLRDTQKFLEAFLTTPEGTLSPTTFIQSTHNTISGQIALITKCYGYNMTFVQNALSFEYALLDGQMMVNEGTDNILVGGTDEKIAFLDLVAQNMALPDSYISKIAEGASFFLLSDKKENALAQLTDVHCETGHNINIQQAIAAFLAKHNLQATDIDCLVYGDNNFSGADNIASTWQAASLNYIDYCGYYFTNSGFGLHLALQLLQGQYPSGFTLPTTPKNVLLLNSYQNKSLALTLIQQP